MKLQQALCASDQKKCAILAMVNAVDQRYTGIYDECCAMLRAAARIGFLIRHIPRVRVAKSAHAADQK